MTIKELLQAIKDSGQDVNDEILVDNGEELLEVKGVDTDLGQLTIVAR